MRSVRVVRFQDDEDRKWLNTNCVLLSSVAVLLSLVVISFSAGSVYLVVSADKFVLASRQLVEVSDLLSDTVVELRRNRQDQADFMARTSTLLEDASSKLVSEVSFLGQRLKSEALDFSEELRQLMFQEARKYPDLIAASVNGSTIRMSALVQHAVEEFDRQMNSLETCASSTRGAFESGADSIQRHAEVFGARLDRMQLRFDRVLAEFSSEASTLVKRLVVASDEMSRAMESHLKQLEIASLSDKAHFSKSAFL